jgi:hypothetical protein
MLRLNGPQEARLRKAMMAAFPAPPRLQRLIADQLDENMYAFVPMNADLEDAMFSVIRWAAERGRLDDLVAGARAMNPRSPELIEFLETIGLTAASGVKPAALEKIVAGNAVFLDVLRWRLGLEERESQVGRVERNGCAVGTAFLVGPDLVLTNFHVIMDMVGKSSEGWGVRFDHKAGPDGASVSAGVLVKFAATDWLVDHAEHSPLDTLPIPERMGAEPGLKHLDFALIQLARPVGDEPRRAQEGELRGWIRVPAQEPAWADVRGISILQHPKGVPLKLALGVPPGLTRNTPQTRLRYTTPTENGSSGSPVFDTDWNLIALHHSGDPKEIDPTYNEAIPIHLITARPAVKAALKL